VGALKELVKKTALAKPYIKAKSLFARPATQNDEALILRNLLSRFDVPKTFVEFGFGGWEFNCAPLIGEWEGLLLDGDRYNVTIANTILPKRIIARQQWITLDTLDTIREYAAERPIGILSIDVDGNDYWFLEALIDLRPAVIINEYNSAFGLRPVTVPYDPQFDRRTKHDSWLYFGASLAALAHLAEKNGYSLIDVGSGGINAFFVRSDLLTADDRPLRAEHAYREKYCGPGSRPSQQWERIKHLPFVDVTTGQLI
jgi:hypothetical protein